MHYPLFEGGVMAEGEPQNRDQQQQQRQQGEKGAVGEQCRQPATVVVTIFLDHAEREAQPVVFLLIAVHAPDGPLHPIHLAPSSWPPARPDFPRGHRPPPMTLPITSRNKPCALPVSW